MLAHINALLGRPEYVRSMGDEVLERQEEMPSLFRNFTLRHMIQAFLHVGEMSTAERASEKLILGGESESGNGWAVAQCQLIIAEIALAKNDAGTTLELIDEMLPRSNNVGFKLVGAQALFIQGKALQMLGEVDSAAVALMDAQGYMKACGARTRLWSIIWARSVNASSRGEYTKAADLRAEARTVIAQVADSIESEDQRERFLSGSGIARE